MPVATQGNFEDLLEGFPKFLRVCDLIELGLYPSKAAVYKARWRGETPPSINLSERKLRFPKNDLISWLSSRQNHIA
jgi:predicted DNA-binding transcriptional regulator AlpA